MSFETSLRTRLKLAVAPIVDGASVEWSRRKAYPAVVMTIVSAGIERHMSGWNGLRRPRVQIDVFALDAPTKVALRDTVLATIAGSDVVDGVRFHPAQEPDFLDMSEETDTDYVFRDMIEAVLPHRLEN